ncbi:hypothetical protein [Rhizobium leguminosarum]|uniref:hypothetical protein n=1 Tax=Rhizobium leguminosarum TaxID=384 RepID=UPI00102F81EB|nr:hypothetical protein [Rhizobium leguminosarum]TAW50588.1 hypothetical protein ELI14_04010 [Rhizobium leguminosarum]
MKTKLALVDNYVQVIGKSLDELVFKLEDIACNGKATLEYVEDVQHYCFNLYEVPAEIAQDLDGDAIDKVAEHGSFIKEVTIYFPEMNNAD